MPKPLRFVALFLVAMPLPAGQSPVIQDPVIQDPDNQDQVLAQNKVLRPGDAAPELHLAELVSVSDQKGAASIAPPRLADYRGKVVVLEFWATWCGACLAAVPHWNAVVDELSDPQKVSGSDFVFLAICDEDRAAIERCLGKIPRKGLVFRDEDSATMKAYDPGTVPHVVVVDRGGKIAAVTDAGSLTVQALDNIAKGRPHGMPFKEPAKRRSNLAGDAPPTTRRHVIQKAKNPGNRMRVDHGRYESIGLPLRVALQSLSGLPHSQVDITLPAKDTNFDILVENPTVERDQIEEYALAVICRELGIRREDSREERDVLVLTRIQGVDGPPVAAGTKRSLAIRGPQLDAKGQSMQPLVEFLSRISGGKPVVDETGLEGTFDYGFQVFTRDDLVQQLAKIGLEYSKGRREVQVLRFVDGNGPDDKDG